MAADAITPTRRASSDAINSRNVKTHAVASIKTLTVDRVAVMPLVEVPGGGEPLAPGGPRR